MQTNKMIRLYQNEGAGMETCFNIEVSLPLSPKKLVALKTLLVYSHEKEKLGSRSFLRGKNIHEVGPRLAFATSDNSNALSIFHSMGINEVTRIEESRRSANGPLRFDRMTECVYTQPLRSFVPRPNIERVYTLPFIEKGMSILDAFNVKYGLALDNDGKRFCFDYFVHHKKRNPTNVEMLDLAFSLSEHSRHPFWHSIQVIDGKTMPETLFQIAKAPLIACRGNDLGGFGDNAGIIEGFRIKILTPTHPGQCSEYHISVREVCITAALESHNHPSAIEPFEGAATGVGGILRDGLCPGQGGDILFLSAGYFGGTLRLKNFHIPGENRRWKYPSKFTSPLDFLIKGSNGATGYANPFGKAVIFGYARAGGMQTPWGERRENIKPTLAGGVVGTIERKHAFKEEPRKRMLIVRIGGAAYWVGLGGGSASSMGAGDNAEGLDYDSVQRGDPEMERKAYQVILAGVERGLFLAAHDQGGSGLGNMVKELLGRAGGEINLRKVTLGDKTLPVKAIWSAEWQESFGFLTWKRHRRTLEKICRRENVPCDVLGEITGDGRIVVFDSKDNSTPVDMDLRKILHDLPQKTHYSETPVRNLKPPRVDWDTPIPKLIRDVFRQLSVGSKGFLVNKGDRSVGGLITRQQCCGTLQQPVADVAVAALGSRTFRGAAAALGEQPWKILLNPEAGGRMSLAEAILNLCAARIGKIRNVNLRNNWMWAAKLPSEAAMLYRTADAARNLAIALGIRQNGGKDSSSKYARLSRKIIKALGELVITAYAPVRDTRLTLTPDIKLPGESYLGYIDLGQGKYRLGGSALLQSKGQLGDECPDLDDPSLLLRVWNTMQELIDRKLILSYHDISDGGLITCLSEMIISGNCGARIYLVGVNSSKKFVHMLFAEELGIVFEYERKKRLEISQVFSLNGVRSDLLFGCTTEEKKLKIRSDAKKTRLDIETPILFDYWQATSARLEEEQMTPALAKEEARWNRRMVSPPVKLTFTPKETSPWILRKKEKPKVAVIREEGSNGHLEMASIIARVGMEPYDVMMNDLGSDLTSFKQFRGMVFVGGFANKDRFGAGRGWHARITQNVQIRRMFEVFRVRTDTWSLGVCNGCQLGALLGWAPFPELPEERRPVLLENMSGKFESRWTTILIQKSPAIMLRDMEGTTFGIWSANKQGKFFFPDESIQTRVMSENLVPMVYVDDTGGPTMQYPCNPNGSPDGIAGLCSLDGRHAIMMPHPERVETVLQCGYIPYKLKQILKASPCLRMFQNARAWCLKN